ncbi:MAG TPA: EcsC family protein [Bacillaceae bacterium]
MNWTDRDEAVFEQLEEWRQSFLEYEATDFENSIDKWMDKAFSLLPEELQTQFFSKLDNWLFHMNSLLRESRIQEEAGNRIMTAARAFHPAVGSLEDLKSLSIDQLTFMAEQHAARHRLYSLAQGGMAGSGRKVFAASDYLALMVINLRAIQVIAMTFGNPVQSPKGLLETLKVYHVATMPERLKMFGWEELMDDLNKKDEEFYFDVPDPLSDHTWIDEPLKQLFKLGLITSISRKKEKLPLLAMAVGAGVNYRTTRKVTDFAIKYYQYKHLWEKSGETG